MSPSAPCFVCLAVFLSFSYQLTESRLEAHLPRSSSVNSFTSPRQTRAPIVSPWAGRMFVLQYIGVYGDIYVCIGCTMGEGYQRRSW
jgi:hypothetical protein